MCMPRAIIVLADVDIIHSPCISTMFNQKHFLTAKHFVNMSKNIKSAIIMMKIPRTANFQG